MHKERWSSCSKIRRSRRTTAYPNCCCTTPMSKVMDMVEVPAGGDDFLQVNSGSFRLALWTIAEIRSMIALTCGICSPTSAESGEPSKCGVREAGIVSNPRIPKKGLGTSP
jgi:hypothetical protein